MLRDFDEHLLGRMGVSSSRGFFKLFLRVVGENYDTLIHDHLQRVRDPLWRTGAPATTRGPGRAAHVARVARGGHERALRWCAHQRDLVAALDTFHHMLKAGERPTRATFEMLIRGCTMTMSQASSFEHAGACGFAGAGEKVAAWVYAVGMRGTHGVPRHVPRARPPDAAPVLDR